MILAERIEGVVFSRLKRNFDERGFFSEVVRFSQFGEQFKSGQISHSYVRKGVRKAWHGHRSQHQLNYLLHGSIALSLFDFREDSPTCGNIIDCTISSQDGTLYAFPPGVLHGYKALSIVHMLYVNSAVYEPEQEIRLKSIDILHKLNDCER